MVGDPLSVWNPFQCASNCSISNSLSKQTEKQASNKVKLIAVAVGVLVTSLVFVVEHLGSVFQVAMQLSGVVAGAMFTMFVLGMCSRSANTKV